MEKQIEVTFLNNGNKYRVAGSDADLLDHVSNITSVVSANNIRKGSARTIEEWAQMSLSFEEFFSDALDRFNAEPIREYVLSMIFQVHIAIVQN